MPKDITLTDVVLSHINANRDGLYTAIPAKITNVANLKNEQSIDVEPVLRKVLSTNQEYKLPILNDVPVVFPSGGGGSLTFPLQVGDNVLVIFSMMSIDDWLDGNGDIVVPSSRRKHNISDGFAIPCAQTYTNNLEPDPDNVVLDYNDLSILLSKDNKSISVTSPVGSMSIASSGAVSIANGAASFTLQPDGSVLHSSGATITAAGDIISAAGISLDNHTHAQGNDTGGNIQQETDPPT